ncbi:MAG TPA: rhodanese-like domain-containing protein [Pyrinomonadaceae bacterium]|nr:rhodanese-like domain-containing protein [Pyrinomonadaceae bacterium]
MKQLRLWLLTILVGGVLLGCVAQQNSNSGNPTPGTQTTPARSQASPQSLNGPPGHDHAAETAVARMGVTEAEAAVKQGEAVLLDVRQAPAYAAGHIKGAIFMPEAEIASRAGTLPKGKKIITYCT